MNTENANGLHADPAALCALGQEYRSHGVELSAQATQLTSTAAAVQPDALGPVGSALTAALVSAAGRNAGQVADLSARLSDAGRTSDATAAAYVDGDVRASHRLESWR